jgi:hypothetical protein
VLGLLELISDDQTEIRSLASILFRGIILSEPKIFDSSISPTELELIKARFLKILQIENSLHIRGKLIDCGNRSNELNILEFYFKPFK